MHRTRAYRRAQRDRKRNKYRKILINQELDLRPEHRDDPVAFAKRVAKMVETPKPNKCNCCCNPRHSLYYGKIDKRTIQERKAIDNERQEYADQILETGE